MVQGKLKAAKYYKISNNKIKYPRQNDSLVYFTKDWETRTMLEALLLINFIQLFFGLYYM